MCKGSCSTGDQNQMSVLHWAVPGPRVAAEILVFFACSHGEGTTHLPEHTCKMCSFSFLKHEILTELPSWELKCCLGLKPKVMNFTYWNILSASHPPLPPAYNNFQVKNQHSARNPEASKVTQTALWRLFLLATLEKALWRTRQYKVCKENLGSEISKVKFTQFL